MTQKGIAALVCSGLLGIAGLSFAAKPERPGPATSASPPPSASARLRSWQADVAESFRKRRPSKDETHAAIAAGRASAHLRRQAHREEARQRYAGLAGRELFEELRVHSRRMAFLSRAKLVATTDLDEPKRGAALARIDKLSAAEQARHTRRVEALKASSAAVVASGAPSAAPSPRAASFVPSIPRPKGSAP